MTEGTTEDSTEDRAGEPTDAGADDGFAAAKPGAGPRGARGVAADASAWVLRALAAYPQPPRPLVDEWEISIAGLVRTVPRVPRFATKPLGLLDGLGAVHVGPEEVGFDGDAVPWDRVLEVRTEPLAASISAEALEQGIAQVSARLPLMPGRAWISRKLAELFYTLYLLANPETRDELLAVERELGGLVPDGAYGADDAAPGSPERDGRTVTQILVRRRFGGPSERPTSITAVLLQIAVPGATEAIVREALERDIPVVHVPLEEGDLGKHVSRAESWRTAAGTVRGRLASLRRADDADGAGAKGAAVQDAAVPSAAVQDAAVQDTAVQDSAVQDAAWAGTSRAVPTAGTSSGTGTTAGTSSDSMPGIITRKRRRKGSSDEPTIPGML
ncbi:hypothetical protein CLV28_3009 [Sediminihabitans luteus]|uniref:Uncharacterized protein n=1 Tax=Sediminihabitans luteus TaxID=1138585 RepID=A0A2M9CC28_9CELL|nr:hypothetical protein [Sediminihabitans luteus]PJJ68593.1 hypothetical protein CLV28_3009 [Sediminihabitans luteus]GII99931.1 hypothetical protein Slu03_23090 [Sediminihabitans luteus]